MINYPMIRILRCYLSSKFLDRINLEDESSLVFRASIFDIDPLVEINNGRYLTLADIGRFNHGFRTGFFKKSRENNLYFTVVGLNAKYRYRIPFGKKFTMTTKIIYYDDKWIYYHHNFIFNNRITTSLLARTGVLKNGKLVKPEDVEGYFEMDLPKLNLPQWVEHWIEADEHFPGFN